MDYVYQNLWLSVLKQAIEDVSNDPGGILSENTLLWFEDEFEDIGSFKWICSILRLNPELIKKHVYQVIRKSKSIAANNSPMEFHAH